MLLPSDTKALFYSDPYQRTVSTWLDKVDRDEKGQLYVVLSASVCYPQGGGQKGDRGQLSTPDRSLSVRIADTRKLENEIRHYVAEDGGQEVLLGSLVGTVQLDLALDWSFRYHQMRLHSAGHLIHCMMERAAGTPLEYPVRSPLGEDDGENQYEYGGYDPMVFEKAASMLNTFVTEPHDIKTGFDKTRGPGFRWWHCEPWNIPCGGVHPANANEIGAVQTSLIEKKGKMRVRFAVTK